MENKKVRESRVIVAADMSQLKINQWKFERTHVRRYDMEVMCAFCVGTASGK